MRLEGVTYICYLWRTDYCRPLVLAQAVHAPPMNPVQFERRIGFHEISGHIRGVPNKELGQLFLQFFVFLWFALCTCFAENHTETLHSTHRQADNYRSTRGKRPLTTSIDIFFESLSDSISVMPNNLFPDLKISGLVPTNGQLERNVPSHYPGFP